MTRRCCVAAMFDILFLPIVTINVDEDEKNVARRGVIMTVVMPQPQQLPMGYFTTTSGVNGTYVRCSIVIFVGVWCVLLVLGCYACVDCGYVLFVSFIFL